MTRTSFNPVAGEIVQVAAHVSYYAGFVGRVAFVSEGSRTRPTLIAVDVGPNRQLDFHPGELRIINQN